MTDTLPRRRLRAGRGVEGHLAASISCCRCHYSQSSRHHRFPFCGIASFPFLEMFSPRKAFPKARSGYRRGSRTELRAGTQMALWDHRGMFFLLGLYFAVDTCQRRFKTKMQLDKFIDKSC